jgi:hypothetical protein
MPLRKIHHPVGAYTAEEKKEFAEMNLTDHAGVRLTCHRRADHRSAGRPLSAKLV